MMTYEVGTQGRPRGLHSFHNTGTHGSCRKSGIKAFTLGTPTCEMPPSVQLTFRVMA